MTKVGSYKKATNFGFVPDCLSQHLWGNYVWYARIGRMGPLAPFWYSFWGDMMCNEESCAYTYLWHTGYCIVDACHAWHVSRKIISFLEYGLYGLYEPRWPLSPKRPINLISLSLVFGMFLSKYICIFYIYILLIHQGTFQKLANLSRCKQYKHIVMADKIMRQWLSCGYI